MLTAERAAEKLEWRKNSPSGEWGLERELRGEWRDFDAFYDSIKFKLIVKITAQALSLRNVKTQDL